MRAEDLYSPPYANDITVQEKVIDRTGGLWRGSPSKDQPHFYAVFGFIADSKTRVGHESHFMHTVRTKTGGIFDENSVCFVL